MLTRLNKQEKMMQMFCEKFWRKKRTQNCLLITPTFRSPGCFSDEPDHFRLRLDGLAGVCILWEQSSSKCASVVIDNLMQLVSFCADRRNLRLLQSDWTTWLSIWRMRCSATRAVDFTRTISSFSFSSSHSRRIFRLDTWSTRSFRSSSKVGVFYFSSR